MTIMVREICSDGQASAASDGSLQSRDHDGFLSGSVEWDPIKSMWFTCMTLGGVIGGTISFNWAALALLCCSTAILVLLGHSIGMHRLLIHQAFECAGWLERIFVYLGVLVGMAGPIGMGRAHDSRDQAQRLPAAHAYFTHAMPFWHDAWWLLHCSFHPVMPMARLATEKRIKDDKFYFFLERTWMLHQLPIALLFYSIAGWGGVFLGICARVSVCIFGHWLLTHIVHRRGAVPYEIVGACVQGHNNLACSIISAGESLHCNHHAFPASAKFALAVGEVDPGWGVLVLLRRIGLIWKVKEPEDLPFRPELRRRT
jgi:stearoyl-CoA desaturase (delta-9 desaturase)